jgi:hypothetical protein
MRTADLGGAGGGQINIVTPSGSSQYHGTVYEFLGNGAMDASPSRPWATITRCRTTSELGSEALSLAR